ncbi:hypothetical protein VSDG_03960 [Cytospora chrysosperma]|uniref:Uncharacterized protein n=1 Tax=Cytospora chrysosperma TaxID=252740 RepID=A0A423W7J0_CYTCH|nr:hypothetical protein VSDG_03960 [Valsa sordida]
MTLHTYNKDTYNKDIYNKDTYNKDTYNKDTYNKDTYNKDEGKGNDLFVIDEGNKTLERSCADYMPVDKNAFPLSVYYKTGGLSV